MAKKKTKKVIVAMSPKQSSLRSLATGQAGGVDKSRKVVVAMSGGVDSSVAAALLKRAGFDVVGVFMKFWKAPNKRGGGGWNRCCSAEAAARARKTAQKLGIPFYVLNLEKEFKKKIVDYFLKEYKQGRIPNPCVVCNKEIKFKFLLQKALEIKADFIATGHYARLRRDRLLMAKDKTKDQSYFLWRLGQKELKKAIFPIGEYTKKQVREMAKKFGLPTAETKDSQGVCFIQKTTEAFLIRYLKQKPGPIFLKNQLSDVQRQIIGEHQGLWFYSIGQRKRIELSGGPYYVLDKDIKKNMLIVTKDEDDLYKKELIAEKVNWLKGVEPKLVGNKARIRYGAPLVTVRAIKKIPNSNRYKVIFARSQRAITPGQSIVFYHDQQLLGGGVIQ